MPAETADGSPVPPFQGFQSPNGTIVPDEFFDQLLAELTDCELRVCLYIIRRTFGFKKDADDISLRQMVDGIRTKDGRVLDRGTGLSKAGAAKGAKGLVAKGVIKAVRNRSAARGNEPTTYRLRFRGEPLDAAPPDAAAPLVHDVDKGGVYQVDKPLSTRWTHNQSVKQQTEYSNFEIAHEKDFFDAEPTISGDAAAPSDGLAAGGSARDVATAPGAPADAPAPRAAGKSQPDQKTAAGDDPGAPQGTSARQADTPPPASPGYHRFRELALRSCQARGEAGPSVGHGDQETKQATAGTRAAADRLVPHVVAAHDDRSAPGSATLGEIIAARTARLAARAAAPPPPNLGPTARTIAPPEHAPSAHTVSPEHPASRPGSPPLSPEERALRATFRPLVSDLAKLFHDEATPAQSLARFVNDYLAAKRLHPELTPEAMIGLSYELKAVVQEYSPTIRTLARGAGLAGVKNKFPYFMELVEVRLGLKPDYSQRPVPPAGTPRADRPAPERSTPGSGYLP